MCVGRFGELREWLREHVHRQGSLYLTDELLTRVTGETLNPTYFVRHLSRKYAALYGISE